MPATNLTTTLRGGMLCRDIRSGEYLKFGRFDRRKVATCCSDADGTLRRVPERYLRRAKRSKNYRLWKGDL